MKVFSIGLFAALAWSGAHAVPGQKDPPRTDPLVGEWLIEKAVRGGHDSTPPAGSKITFTADGRALIRDGKRGKDEPNTYTTDPKKDPPEIDIRPRGKTETSFRGIYKLEGDSLIMCVTVEGDRPKQFESPDASEVRLITMRRTKKMD
jgi:uncharacterized protein (TIGR03067 family)